MDIEADFKELLGLLNKHKVRYCVIGAFAFGFHARPRYTKDMDILIEPVLENAQKIVKALNEFGFQSLNLTEADFCKKNQCIQLGYEPVRVDLLTSIKGLSFSRVWKNKVKGSYGGEKVFFIGLNELMKAKEIANRDQDVVDLKILSEVKQRKKKKNE